MISWKTVNCTALPSARKNAAGRGVGIGAGAGAGGAGGAGASGAGAGAGGGGAGAGGGCAGAGGASGAGASGASAGGGGAGAGGAAEHATNRDRKLGRMIVLLSAIVFICYLPSTMCLVFMMIYQSFSIMGDEVNIFFMAWSWVFVFDATNSSANIFLYYSMSSKYRATFHSLFGWVKRDRKVGPSNSKTYEPTNVSIRDAGHTDKAKGVRDGGEQLESLHLQSQSASDTKTASTHPKSENEMTLQNVQHM